MTDSFEKTGDIDTFLKQHPLTASTLEWCAPPSATTLNLLTIPIGYTAQELSDPAFRQIYRNVVAHTQRDLAQDKVNFALYTGEEPDLNIRVTHDAFLDFDAYDLHTLRKSVAEITGHPVDLIHIMPNPAKYDHSQMPDAQWKKFGYFGYDDSKCLLSAGPFRKEEQWEIAGNRMLAHELCHAVSSKCSMQYDPCYFNDYYFREKLATGLGEYSHAEAQLLRNSCLTEYALESKTRKGEPLPSASFLINYTLEALAEKGAPVQWHDTGLTFQDMLSSKDIYRILAPHNGQSLMASGQPYFERIEQYAPSTYQYELFGNATDLYLAHQGRITHPALLKAQEAFVAQQPPGLQMHIVDYAETLASNSPEAALQHTIDYKQNMDRLLPKAGEKPKNAHYRG